MRVIGKRWKEGRMQEGDKERFEEREREDIEKAGAGEAKGDRSRQRMCLG